jgi:hypothetical protein
MRLMANNVDWKMLSAEHGVEDVRDFKGPSFGACEIEVPQHGHRYRLFLSGNRVFDLSRFGWGQQRRFWPVRRTSALRPDFVTKVAAKLL